jgi:16S rRNA C967 or C1407 C5-methylase (RsmB/RsmF family)/NOL1/NOP2/fmu family ribosome biogenesis protein
LKHLPESFLQPLKADLGDEMPLFLQALEEKPPVSIRFNPFKNSQQKQAFDGEIAWHTVPQNGMAQNALKGVYLSERPSFTLDPSFHAGAYYVQEASSMFIAEAVSQSIDYEILSKPLMALDLCAAPGGKSTLLASILSKNSLLVANEVIKNRVEILKENIHKWGIPNAVISNHDSEDFEGLEGFFDIVLVDAPCSGEGLFRKDEKAINEWSPESVQACSARQKRILANAAKLVKSGGILLYSTCTYNDFENKNNALFLSESLSFQSLKLDVSRFNIVEKTWQNDAQNPVYGYQFYPHKIRGEGFFLSIFKNNSIEKSTLNIPKLSLAKLPRKQLEIAQKWLKNPDDFEFFIKGNDEIFIVLKENINHIALIDKALKRKSLGTVIGEIKGTDFIPSHELALSTAIADTIPFVDLDKTNALKFLKKEDIDIPENTPQGWTLARYEGLNIGWMKVLKNRINNYLPKDFRIRMEIPA